MPILPILGAEYANEDHRDVIARMNAFYAESITINQSAWGEGDIDMRFYTGDQTLWNEYGQFGNLPSNRRRTFTFNHIRRIISMISGHQRKNRKSTIVVPVENADAETADQLSKVLLWLNNSEGVLETISDAFESSLITGMSLLNVWVDYRSDPVNGNIKVDVNHYNQFIMDPFFKKHDLSDCNAIWKRTFISKKEALSLCPDATDEVMQVWGNDNRDGKFQFMAESYSFGMKNLLSYDEFWYRDYRKQKMLVDTETGESKEWVSNATDKNDDNLKLFLQTYPSIKVIEQDIPTVRLAVVLQGKVLYDGPNPLGIDNYPFVPVYCYYHPEIPYFPLRIQSVVRNLRDAAFLYNRRKAIELDICESTINSGWKYKEDALVNPRDIFLTGQGKGLALKSEAQMQDVEQIIAPQIPPSMFQLSEGLAAEMQSISGVNEELLGSADDDKAGILSMLRQGASLTTLQGLFDQLDRSQKLLGNIIVDIVQANFTPGKVMRIIEGQPSQRFYDKLFGRYNAAVEEGLNTTTQRQMQFAQLLQLRETGIPIPDDVLLEACTLQDKKKLIERITEQQRQQAQMQQMQTQVALQEQQAKVDLAHARAEADRGLGIERTSRVQENQALAEERRAAAIHDEDEALLAKVKALKELESIDFSHLKELLQMSHALKEQARLDQAHERAMNTPLPQPQGGGNAQPAATNPG